MIDEEAFVPSPSEVAGQCQTHGSSANNQYFSLQGYDLVHIVGSKSLVRFSSTKYVRFLDDVKPSLLFHEQGQPLPEGFGL
jgi:hypothetical protein